MKCVYTRTALLLLATAGIAISIYLLWAHIYYNYTPAQGHTICSLSAKVSCAPAATSSWSTLLGIPIASIGLGYYIGFALLTLKTIHAPHPGRLIQLMTLLSTLSVIYSVTLLIVTLTIIQVPCPFCFLLYVINVIILFLIRPFAASYGIRRLFRLATDHIPRAVMSREFLLTMIPIIASSIIGHLIVDLWK